jgi:putative transcriptional regulator
MARFSVCLAAIALAFAAAAGARDLAAERGEMLVARADLPDPNFSDSVILVTHSEDAGTAGLIVNRPTNVPVSSLFPDLDKLASLPDTIWFGGPVGVGQIVFLVRADTQPRDSVQVMHGLYLSESGALLRELLGRAKPTEGLRIYAGSAGWMPAQLKSEMTRGDWHRLAGDPDLVFSRRPETLWRELDARANSIQARASLH